MTAWAIHFFAYLHLESPAETLEKLKAAMEDEMNSVTNCLRNTFLNKIPTEEEIKKTCKTLADKLCADHSAKNDAKLALMDVLDEALQGLKINFRKTS